MTAQDLIIKRQEIIDELNAIFKEFQRKPLDQKLYDAALAKVKQQYSGDIMEFIVIESIFGRLR